MHCVLLHYLFRAIGVMAIEADRPAQDEAMLGGCVVVNLVTTDAGDIAAFHRYVAGVADNMIPGFCEIDLKIGKKIVARHEVVGVGKAARSGLAAAQMALPANGNDLLGIGGMLLREPDERCVVGVILGRHAVTGITIERRCGEGVGLRVDRKSTRLNSSHL